MSNTKKILRKLDDIDSKLNEVLSRLSKLESKKVSNSNNATITSTPNVKVGKVVITEYNDHILITGDTFDIRNDFKLYRGKWDGDSKGWKIIMKNIEDYDEFKTELKDKCTKLDIKQGANTLKNDTTDSPSNSGGGCMIMDSSDSESE